MNIASRWILLSGLLLGGCTNSFGDKAAAGGSGLAAPTNLAGTPGGPVPLTWSDNSSNETGFRLEVHTAAFGTPPYLDVIFLPANTTATTFAGPPNTTLRFRVYAITATTQSEPSNEITVLTPNTPGRPTNFTALPISYTQVELQWAAPGNQTQYTIERYDTTTSTFNFIGSFPGGQTSYVDTLPYTIPAQFPVHRIRAENGLGAGAWSTAAGMSFWNNPSSTTATTPPTMGPYDYGLWSSMATDGGGQLFVSYYDQQERQLWFNKYNSSVGWANSVVMGGIGGGFDGTSLALDRNGNIHIAGVDYGSGLLFLNSSATGAPSSWSSSMVDVSIRKHPQLKISQGAVSDTFHLVYHYDGGGFNGLRYASRVGAGPWSFNTIPITALNGSVPGLAIDSSGGAHILLSADFSFDLYHWTPTGGFDLITSAGGPYEHLSLAVDGSGTLHAAYNEASTGRLMYATNPGGAWTTQVAHAHSRGNLGRHNSIVADASGNVFISYYDAVWGNLWQARKSAGATEFVTMLVVHTGDVGRYTSSLLDGGNVSTSCYDVTSGSLRVFWVAR